MAKILKVSVTSIANYLKRYNIPTRAPTSILINMDGKRFGRLIVIKYHTKKHSTKIWECICNCGNTTYVSTGALRGGVVKSCGCLHKEWASLAGQRENAKRIISNNLKVNYPRLCEEWDYITNKEEGLGKPEDYSSSTQSKVWWLCNKHGSYRANINDRTGKNSGCSKCSSSHGEREIIQYLDSKKIAYLHDCKYVDLGFTKARIDFYLPDYDLYIEFHGIQHYEPWPLSHPAAKRSQKIADKVFKKQQKRDKALRKTLSSKLIEISYQDMQKITKILEISIE